MEEDALTRYRRMRDFTRTPEPSGAPVGRPPPSDQPRFVIQQHDATRLHWDLRLEHEGVLLSWALPRGVPWHPDDDRLAVHTEDHPIEYLEFHGSIPQGEYGGGDMTIWDRGTYLPDTIGERKVTVVLDGERVKGRFALFATRGRDWMIHRMDPPQDPERRPLPVGWQPMRATPGALPEGDEWAFEILWIGQRALLTNDAGHVTLKIHDGADVGDRFPELRRLGRRLGALEVVLDVVIVAVDRGGRPVHDRSWVDRRLAASSDSRARRLSEDHPVAAICVDLLWMEGHPTTGLPYRDRRALLDELGIEGQAAWQAPRYHRGDGTALLQAARGQGIRGLVAKRLGSTYEVGATTRKWIEVVTAAP